ncbi:MAG: O-antigen ligase family protein [Bacteroidetes bacterium]|nr:O-antigen ligase family protein [Bacteroidota bacterium]
MIPEHKAHHIFFVGVIVLVAALPLSMFVMSIAQFVIIAGWLLSGNILEKFKQAFSKKLVLIKTGFFFIHVIGLFWTSDFGYAFKDLRIKLPLLALPVIFSTTAPFSKKEFEIALKFFVAAVLVSTLISTSVYLGLTSKKITDIREISIFISHIRLSLLVCMAVFTLIWFWMKGKKSGVVKIIIPALVIWFVCFLVLLESVTGLGILFFVLIVFSFGKIISQKRFVYLAIIMPALIGGLFTGFKYWNSIYKNVSRVTEQAEVDEKTLNGNMYVHHLERFDIENGFRVYWHICEPELEAEWNRRSKLSYNGLDNKGNGLKYTLWRYLTSLNLKKDSAGVTQLTDDDIIAIENGIPNHIYLTRNKIYKRLHTIAWEINNYKQGGNPSGHSVTMRFEFWNTALFIIKKHMLKGVGTGDVPIAFKRAYIQTHSPLDEKWRLRAHNQFLTIAVALGIFWLAYFIFSLIAPVYLSQNGKSFLFLSFLLTAILSMLTEDTIETQAGVTFFAVFNALYLWGSDRNAHS